MKIETVLFDTVAPHPGPICIADLLTDIEATIKKHVILSPHAAAALAVWILHTYTFELRDTVAYVAIESPEKRCGKTTLLSVLAAMAHRPLISSNITVGALFRAIHNYNPTLFIDEADTFLAGNGIMRGIINSGNTRRTAYVVRLSASKNSKLNIQNSSLPLADFENSTLNTQNSTLLSPTDPGIKRFSCWCPKVIAMIGETPDTISDRSIVVKMSRKLTTETCAPLAALNTKEIRAKCARFALDAADTIQQHPKITGQGLNDRAADTFDPLFVIARHAGPEWEKKLHAAALALSATADTENSGSGLILDILEIFADTDCEKMFSRDVIALLREGRLKSQTLRGPFINEYNVSKILRQYHIRPINIRIGKEVHRGYVASDFREAAKRYVSVADVETRFTEMQHRWDLQTEAHAEAARQQALMEKIRPMIAGRRNVTDAEMQEMLHKLEKDREMESTAASLSAEVEKENDSRHSSQ